MRAIIRVSISGENNGALRNRLAAIATRHGCTTERGGQATGTWTDDSISTAAFFAVTGEYFTGEYWGAINQHPGPGHIDSIWSMVDDADPRERLPRAIADLIGDG